MIENGTLDRGTVEELASELYCALRLIREAVPMAVEAIKNGTVPIFDQWAFWTALNKAENYYEVLDADRMKISEELDYREEELRQYLFAEAEKADRLDEYFHPRRKRAKKNDSERRQGSAG